MTNVGNIVCGVAVSYKFCGKELDRMDGLDWYDSEAAKPYFEKLIQLDPNNSLAKKFFEAEKAAQEAAAAAAAEAEGAEQ